MRKTSEIKAFFETTFTNFEGIKTVKVGGYDEVSESVLNDMEYPLLWVMYPFQRQIVYQTDTLKAKWKFEVLVLNHAKFDEIEKIRQNFDDCQDLGSLILYKLEEIANSNTWTQKAPLEFNMEADVQEWQPKERYGADNCNGWLIPFSITTEV